jgi:hypothetical protein
VPWITTGTITVTSAAGVEDANGPIAFALHPNSPNPFGLETLIRFSIPKAGRVRLNVFDVNGREVATLVDGQRPAGTYDVRWVPASLRSGVYFYRLESAGRREVRKLLKLR